MLSEDFSLISPEKGELWTSGDLDIKEKRKMYSKILDFSKSVYVFFVSKF